MTYFYGRNRDYHDPRDLIFQAGTYFLIGGPVRHDVTLSLKMPPIFDQGQEGSCTANAGIRFRRWLSLKFPAIGGPDIDFSRQALYYWERNLSWNDTPNEDSGANSRDIFYVLKNVGACPEADDPYLPDNLFVKPSQKAVTDAFAHRIGTYHRILTLQGIKSCLLAGYALTLGFQVFESFETIGSDGIWNPNVDNEQIVGGHEVFVRGYDDLIGGGSLVLDNSWGPDWGAAGSFYMPYSFVNNYSASGWDAWTGNFTH